jgi:hypothetical protein
MIFNQVLNNLNYIGSPSLVVRAGRKSGHSDSDSNEPIVHVNEYPGHPGNCWKYGCSCTPLNECTECDDYKGLSKRKRKKRKDKKESDAIISDSEKAVLRAFRQQDKFGSQFDDFEPLGGAR